MFLPEVRNIFVSRTQILRLQHMFSSLATQGNIRSKNVSATMFHSLARPLNTDCLICLLGYRLVVDTNVTHLNQTAVLVSPVYNRSHYGHSKCLRFRYMLRGPGETTLTIYQKADNSRKTPVWVARMETGSKWMYGQLPLSSVSKFQVMINQRPLFKDSMVWLSQEMLIKKWWTCSVRLSSYMCTREVAKHERSVRVARGDSRVRL